MCDKTYFISVRLLVYYINVNCTWESNIFLAMYSAVI